MYDLYVVFYVVMLIFFSMLCSRYVYMQTHVLFMSKNKDDKGWGKEMKKKTTKKKQNQGKTDVFMDIVDDDDDDDQFYPAICSILPVQYSR